MNSEFDPVYDPDADYRLINHAEYKKDLFSLKHWSSTLDKDYNMNFLFGVDVSQDIASYLYKNNLLEGDLYNLNPEHPSSNHNYWTLYKQFLRKKRKKPLIKIPSIL